MPAVDEGLIHAWLDGQLSPAEAARVEALVNSDAAWGAAAAEARGLIAGASRALSALDDVPRAGARGTGGASGASGASGVRSSARSRSIARAPWLRAAAAVVLVVGIGATIWSRMPDAERTLSEATTRSVAPPPAQSPSEPAPRPTLREAPPPTSARDAQLEPPATRAVAAASDTLGRADAAKMIANEREQSVMGAAVGAAVGTGRGERMEQRDVARSPGDTAIKSVTALVALDACWQPVDSASRARADDVFVLRLATPVATDIGQMQRGAVASGAAGGRGGGRAAGGRAVAAPPPPQSLALTRQASATSVRTQYTYPRQYTDSTFITEWIVGDGHRQLTFSVRGDTLRGTTVRIAGDMVFAADPIVAVRVRCPQ